MNEAYAKWISAKLATDTPLHHCAEWTEEMKAQFPELTKGARARAADHGI